MTSCCQDWSSPTDVTQATAKVPSQKLGMSLTSTTLPPTKVVPRAWLSSWIGA